MFHNEAFPDSDSSNGNGSCLGSPDDEVVATATRDGVGSERNKSGQDLSPQRSHSFINVVINAIRNAASLKKDAQGMPSHVEKRLLPKQIERIQGAEGGGGIFGSKIEGK